MRVERFNLETGRLEIDCLRCGVSFPTEGNRRRFCTDCSIGNTAEAFHSPLPWTQEKHEPHNGFSPECLKGTPLHRRRGRPRLDPEERYRRARERNRKTWSKYRAEHPDRREGAPPNLQVWR
jgi:hypothetical protein